MLSTGIDGLDTILGGGIPEGHIVTIFGAYGTGKTTFAIHFIYEGLKNGEKCIFISLDEDEKSIIDTAKGFGMDFEQYSDNIVILKLDPVSVKESMEKVKNDLFSAIKQVSAKRMVVDTISILEGLFDEKERWLALSYFKDIIKKSGITAIFTSEADRFSQTTSKYAIIEYVSDGAIALKYIRKSEIEEPVLALEVIKMRRVKHSRKLTPYMITENGIKVLEGAELF